MKNTYFRKVKTVNFTYSCSEKINERTQYCDVCRLHVRDISGMKEQQIKELIKSNNGSMCATFDESQFSFINDVSEPISFKWKRYLAASIVSASLLGPVKTNAQVKVNYEIGLLDSLNKLKTEKCAFDTIHTKSFSSLKLYRNHIIEIVDTCENKTISYVNERKKRHISLFRIGRKKVILRTRFPFIVLKRNRVMGRLLKR